MIISPILIFLAAVFNAFMDTFENENFGESILKGWSKWFYYKRESWKTAPRLGGYKFDG